MTNEFDLTDLTKAAVQAAWTPEGHEPDTEDVQDARRLLAEVFHITAVQLAKNGRVEYKGLGTFKLVQRAARRGLLNGQPWETPELMEVEFEPAPAFLEAAQAANEGELRIA